MKTLKLGSTGNQVEKWQYFLRGLGYHLDVTGEFDELTDIATKKFQEKNKLYVDGIVGNQTFGKAAMLGFPIIDVNDDYNPEFPNKPDFKPITGTKLRQEMFGPLEFESAPTKSNPEGLKITNNFKNKIVPVEIPQLIGIKGAPKTGIIYVHMKVRDQIQGLWAEWGRLGLLDRILTFDGVFMQDLYAVKLRSKYYQIMLLGQLLILMQHGIHMEQYQPQQTRKVVCMI